MFDTLPWTAREVMDWEWAQFAPYYADLEARALDAASVDAWLADWTRLAELLSEINARLNVATTQNTADEAAEQAYRRYLDTIVPAREQAEFRLQQKLIASGLEPDNFAVPLRAMRGRVELFRAENLPLLVEEAKLGLAYNKIIGAQTVAWEGEERTLDQLRALTQGADRATRERAWRLAAARQLADREAINDLWRQFMGLRRQIAANAGFDDYRAYRWLEWGRYDYTPADCATFAAAIEEVVVPAASRVYARYRAKIGADALRPWDMDRDDYAPPSYPPLRPYADPAELDAKAETIFRRVDPQLGEYFAVMRREGLLDLHNRKGKAPGGYCTAFPVEKRPFIFMNATGLDSDVRTLLHEAGHAFHVFESAALPYAQQRRYPIEFAEVASMAMELLSSPYWAEAEGGYYSPQDAAHARRDHLERILLFWPYMAVVDSFQHWVYTHHDEATEPAACDAKWAELWDRFIPAIDWSGFEAEKQTGWHRKLHIHRLPFYYVDYGLAQLGAVQVWRNARRNQAEAVAAYRRGLALGGTRTLPELYAAAGARFAFDVATVREAVDLIETALDELEPA
ncbi:MAG: M3 family oligoendopeptidase [Aggregatilineales bacterium]